MATKKEKSSQTIIEYRRAYYEKNKEKLIENAKNYKKERNMYKNLDENGKPIQGRPRKFNFEEMGISDPEQIKILAKKLSDALRYEKKKNKK
jgi:hypothetical protein